MATILSDSVAAVVIDLRTRPQAVPLAMITMRKSIHEFPFLFCQEKVYLNFSARANIVQI